VVGIGLLTHGGGPFCVVIDKETLRTADDVALFYDYAIDLSVEFAANAAFLARSPGGPRSLRDEGVLRGLVVRNVKLLDRLVSETTERHGEMQSLLSRLLLEASVNLKYLLNSEDRTQIFVEDGMLTPLRRKEEIENRIAERGGIVRTIEERQLRAIGDEFALAEFDPASKPRKLVPMDQRIEDAFDGSVPLVYDFGYRTGSSFIHGGWKDLISGHIYNSPEFEAALEWKEPDPQVLLSALMLQAPALAAYAAHIGHPELRHTFESMIERVRLVFELYGPLFESRRGHL
jgi:uncharacterized protein DUF5677